MQYHDRQSLVWLYSEAVCYPERSGITAYDDVISIFGDPDGEAKRIFGYNAADQFYSISFENDDDEVRAIIGWSKQP